MFTPGSKAELISLTAAAVCLVGGLVTWTTVRDSAPLSIQSPAVTRTIGDQK